MKLRASVEPEGATDALQEGLRVALRSRRNSDILGRTGDDVGGSPLSATVPHAVFHLRAADLRDEHPLSHAHQVGLRYFVGNPDDSAMADVAIDQGGGVVGFRSLTRGDLVTELWRAFDIATEREQGRGAEARTLEVPEIYLAALWLVVDDGEDEFIPLEQCGPLAALEVYAESAFISGARSVVRDKEGQAYPA